MRSLSPGEDERVGLNSAVLGVGRVEFEGSICTLSLFLFNATGREQRVSVSPHVADASGREFEAASAGAPGQAVSLASGHLLCLWPRFRVPAERAPGSLQISVVVEGYGQLHVPAREQMTNVGPWDDLPPAARERLASAFDTSARFKWWGSPR